MRKFLYEQCVKINNEYSGTNKYPLQSRRWYKHHQLENKLRLFKWPEKETRMSHHFPEMLAIRQRKSIAQYTSSNLVCIIDSGPDWLNQVPELQRSYIFPISLSTSGYEALNVSMTCHLPNLDSHWRRSGIFIVNFEHISHLVLVFLLLTLSR